MASLPHKAFRYIWLAFLCLFATASASAQGTVIGQETTVVYSGNNASLSPPNTPATNFSQNGTNTFILPLQPTSAIRVYLTNNTANACLSTFLIQMFAASDAQVASFNNSLSNWQTVPLQNPNGTLTSSVSLNIPASSAVYVSSTAIASPKVAIQIWNTQNACATTTLEATAVITTVSVTSPLISLSGGASGFNNGLATNVQGLVAQQVNGGSIYPVVSGGLQPPTNFGFTNSGFDSVQPAQIQVSQNGVQSYTPNSPTPSANGETTIAFTTIPSNGTLLAPWTCTQPSSGPSCGGIGNGTDAVLVLNNTTSNTPVQINCNNCNNQANQLATYITFGGVVTLRNGESASNVNSKALVNTLAAGSIEVFAMRCNAQPCFASNVTDTQGNTYKQVSVLPGYGNGVGFKGMTVWATTKGVVGGADTITATPGTGVASPFNDIMASEVQCQGSVCPITNLNQPTISFASDAVGAEVVEGDALNSNKFNCTVTLSTNTTTQCEAAPTLINSASVRLYVTDMQINTTTAGTATVITLVDGTGANCGTNTANLSAITYTNTAIGLTNLVGTHTPLIAPVQSAVCVQQSGTTAGTSVVELRGFIAP